MLNSVTAIEVVLHVDDVTLDIILTHVVAVKGGHRHHVLWMRNDCF